MDYIAYDIRGNRHTYHLSYSDLKERYYEYIDLSDADFKARLPEIIHFAVFVSYVKELSIEVCSDYGILHELAHLLHCPEECVNSMEDLRKNFKNTLKLA